MLGHKAIHDKWARWVCLVLCFSISSVSSLLFSQTFGNEWIEYGQQYISFEIGSKNWVQLDYDQLITSSLPLDGSSASIQVFARERQVPIEMVDGGDGTFDSGDYFRFQAQPNDGWLDSLLYVDPELIGNPYYSLFNDSLQYFVTVGDPQSSLRIETIDPITFEPGLVQDWMYGSDTIAIADLYLFGQQDQYGISNPTYTEGEGWYSTRYGAGGGKEVLLETRYPYYGADGDYCQIHVASVGASNAEGNFNHHLQVLYNNDLILALDTIYSGYKQINYSFEIPNNQISNFTKVRTQSIDDLGVATDFQSIGHVTCEYARQLHIGNATGASFRFQETDDEVIHMELAGFLGTDPVIYIGQPAHHKLIPNQDGAFLSFAVPSIIASGEVFHIVDQAEIMSINGLSDVGQTGYFTDFSLPLDSAFVMIAPDELWDEAVQYQGYRSLGSEVLLARVEELYQQYGGGIRKHPLSIRRFADHLIQTWPEDPAHLFLVGKSIQSPTTGAIAGTRKNPELFEASLLPTWGYPSSDLPFTAGLGGTLLQPAIPTGRIAAKTPEELLSYLDKVIAHESATQAEWMKTVLHFGGGGNLGEQNLFKAYLNIYESLASDTCFGADVHTFLKNSTDPIQFDLSQDITDLINNGASIMTFFGHASSTGFDQNIDNPEAYDNEGRYPLLIGNSCYTGNIHLSSALSTSEQFVLADQRGVIGFLAKGDLGIPAYLNMFTKNFYRNQFQLHYGESIGQGMKRAIEDFQLDGQDFYRANAALTFALHGDPAVKLHLFPQPDYEIKAQDLWFNPDPVTTAIDSFEVHVALANLGKATNDNVGIELIRKKADGTEESFLQETSTLFFKDTVSFTLPVDPINGLGQNFFDVLVDYPSNTIPESDDVGNNLLSQVPLFIVSGSLVPVEPYKYAIWPEAQVTLKASTGDPLAVAKDYLFELDTVASFDSPALIQIQINAPGGVVEWELASALEEEKVYYWRTTPLMEDSAIWQQSSFQYLPQKRGWSHAHFDQLTDNHFNRLTPNEVSQSLDFFTGQVQLTCTVYGSPANSFESLATRYQLNLDIQDYSGCGTTPAIHVAVLDSATLEPWESNYAGLFPENDFDNLMLCADSRERPEKYFIFRQNNAEQLAGFVDMVENRVPDGHYLLIYSWRFANYDGWDANEPQVYEAFENLGAQQIGQAQDSVPFIFFMKKGYPETIQEIYGSNFDDLIELNTSLTGSYDQGSLQTVNFGPALQWQKAEWEWGTDLNDIVKTSLNDIGTNALIQSELNASSIQLVDQGISASQYPWLNYGVDLKDSATFTPGGHEFLRLTGTPAPEFALHPPDGFLCEIDSLDQGAEARFTVAISNVSAIDGDSLLVDYWVENPDRERTDILTHRLAPLPAGNVIRDTISFSTLELGAYYTFWMEVNPAIDGQYDQLEQYHFNNLLTKPIFIREDEANPILDVTFDGVHILDGELVSAKPEILITLRDNNLYTLMDEPADTALFQIFLRNPAGQESPIYFSNFGEEYVIDWTPSFDADEAFKILFKPILPQDGEYHLRVNAMDKKGNDSGEDYLIRFEVINEASITEVLNYPNPFTTHTQFVFTLTGSIPPDQIMIQIMTVRGTVVKEVFADELGTLRIGKNITSYAWDGKDQFGDQLAPGLYLYRVKARLAGEELKLRETSANSYFKEGYGKMYLLR